MCHIRNTKNNLQTLVLTPKNSFYLQQLIEKDKLILPGVVCKTLCLASIETNKLPIYSILNNMRLNEPPKELKGLNIFEKILCQIESFMVIVQLTTKSKNSKQYYNMRAIKGHVIHLPLPTNATLNNVYKTTLPNTDYFHILVDSLKTSSGNIWQNLVNLKKINSALTVLNKIHKLYQNKKPFVQVVTVL